jgi:hypothetical protein
MYLKRKVAKTVRKRKERGALPKRKRRVFILSTEMMKMVWRPLCHRSRTLFREVHRHP